MPQITIKPDNITFICNINDNILESALTNQVNLSYGCKNGLCGSCKYKIINGDFVLDEYNKSILNNEEIKEE